MYICQRRTLSERPRRRKSIYCCQMWDLNLCPSGPQSNILTTRLKSLSEYERHINDISRTMRHGSGSSRLCHSFITCSLSLPIYVHTHTRRLLFLASEHVLSEGSGVGDTLPYSYTLNHLFSRAPDEMRSPHKVSHPPLPFHPHPSFLR